MIVSSLASLGSHGATRTPSKERTATLCLNLFHIWTAFNQRSLPEHRDWAFTYSMLGHELTLTRA